jgi:CRP/FNR family cyclic AMP-dependent transcriptional regulator
MRTTSESGSEPKPLPEVQHYLAKGGRSNACICRLYGPGKLFCTSKEGKTLILKIAMPGDVLGLGAMISGSAHELTTETLRPTQIKSIPRNDFLSFLEKRRLRQLKWSQGTP